MSHSPARCNWTSTKPMRSFWSKMNLRRGPIEVQLAIGWKTTKLYGESGCQLHRFVFVAKVCSTLSTNLLWQNELKVGSWKAMNRALHTQISISFSIWIFNKHIFTVSMQECTLPFRAGILVEKDWWNEANQNSSGEFIVYNRNTYRTEDTRTRPHSRLKIL